MNLSSEIDILEFTNISKEYFLNNYIKKNKPAIIKGILDATPAGKSWTIDKLYKRLGDFPIRVFNAQKNNGTSFLFGKHTVPMSTMFDLIKENSRSNLRMFVNPILKKDKLLAAELPCPNFFKGRFQLHSLLFLGGKGTVVPLHYDFMKDDGLLTQFYGRKEIILIEYSQCDLLYKLPLNSTSLVNLFEPDFSQYPALKKIKGTHLILEHGDTLFIPSGYWHQIKYVDASMSVAFRRWNINPRVTLKMFFVNIFQVLIDKTMQAIMGKYWLNIKIRKAKLRAERTSY